MENSSTQPASFVYVIGESSSSYVKIGYTRKLKERLSGIQTGNPRKLSILAAWPGTEADEANYHLQFSAYRREGEWFDLPICILNSLKRKSTYLPPAPKPKVTGSVRLQEFWLRLMGDTLRDLKGAGVNVSLRQDGDKIEVYLPDVHFCRAHRMFFHKDGCLACNKAALTLRERVTGTTEAIDA